MAEDYEYYGIYNPHATGLVNLEEALQTWLWNAGLMLEFINQESRDILDSFLEKVKSKFSDELKGANLTLDDVNFDSVRNDSSLLGSYPDIKDLILRMATMYLALERGYNLSGEKEPIKYLDILRLKHMPLYLKITTLVELLGREDGIQFYKDFVQYWGKEQAKKVQVTTSYEDVRKSTVEFWNESGGFEFAVVDIDDHQYLAKFDRCAWYESMTHVEDQELAYYTVCYPGPRLGRHNRQNVWMRRTVTLFTGEFCDELRWDRHVHDEPEQPSLEFSKRLIRK